MGVKGIERPPIIRGKWKAFAYSTREIRVGNKVTAESNRIGRASFDDRRRRIRFEAASSNESAFKNLAQAFRGYRSEVCMHEFAASNSRFDDVQVRQAETVQVLGDLGKERVGIAV